MLTSNLRGFLDTCFVLFQQGWFWGPPFLENLYYFWTTIFLYADYIFLNIYLSYPHTIVVYSVHSDQTQIKGWLQHVKQRIHIGLSHTHIPIIVPMVRSLFPYTYPLNPTNMYPHTSLFRLSRWYVYI